MVPILTSLQPIKATGSVPVSGSSQATSTTRSKSETTSSKPSLTFANSSLSGFAAAASPFSALGGSSKGSVFGSPAPKAPSVAAAPQNPTLNFSQASGASPFSGLASASTGGFGGSFASPFTGGSLGQLSSFAKPGESLKSDKKPRAFGAPDSDAEESDDDDDSVKKASSEDGDGDDEKGESGKDEAQTPGDDKKKPRLQKGRILTLDTQEYLH